MARKKLAVHEKKSETANPATTSKNTSARTVAGQFVGGHNLDYQGCHSRANERIWQMTARCCGIRDICHITGYSCGKVQAALKRSVHQISPKRTHYQTLQSDEFWTSVGKKRNSEWHRGKATMPAIVSADKTRFCPVCGDHCIGRTRSGCRG